MTRQPGARSAISVRRRSAGKRQADISALIPIIRNTAALVGFEIAGRITLIDKETGKKYK